MNEFYLQPMIFPAITNDPLALKFLDLMTYHEGLEFLTIIKPVHAHNNFYRNNL